MTRHAAMNVLYQTIAALDAQIASLNAEREQARTALSALVEAEGGKVVFAGIAMLEITRPTVIASYDRTGIEGIVCCSITSSPGSSSSCPSFAGAG